MPSNFPSSLLPRPLFFSIILACRQFLHNVDMPQPRCVSYYFQQFSSFPILVNTSSFLILSVHFTLISLRHNHISNLSKFLSSFFLKVRVSLLYNTTLPIKHLTNYLLLRITYFWFPLSISFFKKTMSPYFQNTATNSLARQFFLYRIC